MANRELLQFEGKIVMKICNDCNNKFTEELTECPNCTSSNYYEDEIEF